eukprot:m.177575 g.177575  ORF g.177575 m.177575 type:complete len:258 (+) comp39163_c0_seq7:932-1705(+)
MCIAIQNSSRNHHSIVIIWQTMDKVCKANVVSRMIVTHRLGLVPLLHALVLLSGTSALDFHVKKDDASGIPVIASSKRICFEPESRDASEEDSQTQKLLQAIGKLQSSFKNASECGRKGLAYNDEKAVCVLPSVIPSATIVASPSSGANSGYKVSLLYCYWHRTRFSSCSSGHSYSGNANFNLGSASPSGSTLTISFTRSYLKEPMCSVDYENQVAFTRIDTRSSNLRLFLHSASGQSLSWSSMGTWMYIICHGEMN